MNLEYPEQLKLKQSKVTKLLGRYGHVDGIIGMAEPLRYRNKATRAFRLRYPNKRIISGIYQSSTGAVVPADDCLLEDKLSGQIIKDLRRLMPKYKALPYDEISRRGSVKFATVRKAAGTGEYMLTIATASPIFPKGAELAKELVSLHPEIKTVVQNIAGTDGKILLGEHEKPLFGDGRITDTLMGLKFLISSKSFYQVNPVQTEKLYSLAVEMANLKDTDRVLDCYCGIGTIGLIASKYCGEVIGVEANSAAVKDAIKNARLNKITNAQFVNMDTGEFLSEMLSAGESADVAFLDPARAGCDKRALESLVKLSPERIVYVSCNPETQARDLGVLVKAGYKVKRIQPVDMFPFTGHVETVCLLSKLNAKQHIEINLDMDELDLTDAEKKATYQEIKDYVLEHSGLKVSSLYIAQVKQKCGIIERENYNKPKSEDAKQPQCPPDKEKAIKEALTHFGMI